MESRTRITLHPSGSDKLLETLSKVLLIVLWGLTLFIFFKLPATIPIHFAFSGKANSYGNKNTLLVLPILTTVIYFGLTQLNKHPHLFNYMSLITVENAYQQYSLATRMLRVVTLVVLLIFSLLILFTYLTAIGITNGVGKWFLPLTLALVLIPTIVYILQLTRKPSKSNT